MTDSQATPFAPETVSTLRCRLESLYGAETASDVLAALTKRAEAWSTASRSSRPILWDEKDAVLITYADQIRGRDASPLSTLGQFLKSHKLHDGLSTVHLLPFCPYSSDDGFSVIDYTQVDPASGTWDDIAALRTEVDLMFDLVLNHCSQSHEWFQRFLADEAAYRDYFHVVDPAADVSQVTRPRSTPLLTPYETAAGTRHVWTTFSADQVDLNFSNPRVLLEMIDVLLLYVNRGARIVRLDAIAYLWKQLGTSCIHLEQTHTVVKLLRDVLDALAPGTILLTETNVPHAENVSYFGEGDEAHMVYQFSLAPLLLDASLSGDAEPLRAWLSDLEPPQPGTTYFNFTASHDGVGVRPLEGLVSAERFQRLVDAVKARGGLVSTRRQPDGSDTPYELNIAYVSALDEPTPLPSELHARRFLSTQAFMLGLQGIPGIYFHSLVGTENHMEGVQETGRARSINRRKFAADDLECRLGDAESTAARIFDGYRHLLRTRRQQPAFHPEARQEIIDAGSKSLLAFRRIPTASGAPVTVVTNFAAQAASFDAQQAAPGAATDLISGRPVVQGRLELQPYETVWLS